MHGSFPSQDAPTPACVATDTSLRSRDRDAVRVSQTSQATLKIAVLANPIRRCGVRLTAEQQSFILQCSLITEPEMANTYDLVYLHWHPNFAWQHPKWASKLRSVSVRTVLVIHDFLFDLPIHNAIAFVSFDSRAVQHRKPITIPMPLQQPYPFKPRTEPNPDMVGFFGFYGSQKGLWTILAYALEHRKLARFITTLHPFAPNWVAAEFAEFRAAAKRCGFEVIDEWLEGQELADAMGECGFFVVLHGGGFGASASVTSAFAANRPVLASKDNQFIKHAADFILEFNFNHFPTERELREAGDLVKQARKVLDPTTIWSSLHDRIVDILHSCDYNLDLRSHRQTDVEEARLR